MYSSCLDNMYQVNCCVEQSTLLSLVYTVACRIHKRFCCAIVSAAAWCDNESVWWYCFAWLFRHYFKSPLSLSYKCSHKCFVLLHEFSGWFRDLAQPRTALSILIKIYFWCSFDRFCAIRQWRPLKTVLTGGVKNFRGNVHICTEKIECRTLAPN